MIKDSYCYLFRVAVHKILDFELDALGCFEVLNCEI